VDASARSGSGPQIRVWAPALERVARIARQDWRRQRRGRRNHGRDVRGGRLLRRRDEPRLLGLLQLALTRQFLGLLPDRLGARDDGRRAAVGIAAAVAAAIAVKCAADTREQLAVAVAAAVIALVVAGRGVDALLAGVATVPVAVAEVQLRPLERMAAGLRAVIVGRAGRLATRFVTARFAAADFVATDFVAAHFWAARGSAGAFTAVALEQPADSVAQPRPAVATARATARVATGGTG